MSITTTDLTVCMPMLKFRWIEAELNRLRIEILMRDEQIRKLKKEKKEVNKS